MAGKILSYQEGPVEQARSAIRAPNHRREKQMKKTSRWAVLAGIILLCSAEPAFTRTPAARDVTALLREFMDAAGRNDGAVFDKFFAADVIYTRATGAVITKADIMNSLKTPPAQTNAKTTYSAEDLTLHEYGQTVVVAFRLEARTEHADGKVEMARYRNTGTFLRRNGRWQVVAWQATKITEPTAPS
jgi:ketosteroid isomerase-like protein